VRTGDVILVCYFILFLFLFLFCLDVGMVVKSVLGFGM
jgi:hypothetical protein